MKRHRGNARAEMEQFLLCRLCLASGVNRNLIETNETIEQILRKFGLFLEVSHFVHKTKITIYVGVFQLKLTKTHFYSFRNMI